MHDEDVTAARQEVLGALETFRRAFHDKDAEAVIGCYAEGAVIASLAPPLLEKPSEADVVMWLNSWDGPVVREMPDMHLTVDGDLSICHGLTHVSVREHDGTDADWWMRVTLCLRRESGSWKIFHEHESVPFYMDGSFRAAIDLKPETAQAVGQKAHGKTQGPARSGPSTRR